MKTSIGIIAALVILTILFGQGPLIIGLILWGGWKLSKMIFGIGADGASKWVELTSGCKYIHAHGKTGIALDVEKKIIHLKAGDSLKTYPFSDIREWRYSFNQPGVAYGGGLTVAMQGAFALKHSMNETGFYVLMRDIDFPEWRVTFKYNNKTENEFKRWMEIFRQYVNQD